jgi:predicted ribosomally synthesized peptide with SipW-like signal peptide
MKMKKVIALLLAAILLVACSVMGTLAYLTSTTETVKNTFTVGDVVIYLDEKDVDESETGENLLHEGRDFENAYEGDLKLIPGCKHEKDPTVWVKEGSEEAYIRVLVTVEDLEDLVAALPEYVDSTTGVFGLHNVVEGWEDDVWEFAGVDGNVYEFRYFESVTGAADNGDEIEDYTALPALFTHIKLPGAELTNEELANLDGVEITVVAHAIQVHGFETVDDAWDAFGA